MATYRSNKLKAELHCFSLHCGGSNFVAEFMLEIHETINKV